MAIHEYEAEQAYEILMKKIAGADPQLSERINSAIDQGKDITETGEKVGRRKKGKNYRKKVPFTKEEALSLAIDILESLFIEQALFRQSAASHFTNTGIGIEEISDVDNQVIIAQKGEYKSVEFEVEIETQLQESEIKTMPLDQADRHEIDEQMNNLSRIRQLVDFD